MCIHIFIITRTREVIEFRHFWGHDHYDIVFNQNQLFSELTLRNMLLLCNSSPSSIRSGSGGLQHPCDWYCNKILKHNLLDNDFQYCTKRHLALVTLKMKSHWFSIQCHFGHRQMPCLRPSIRSQFTPILRASERTSLPLH